MNKISVHRLTPDMRGRGIADSLLECACDYAKENGFDYIEGYCTFFNIG